MLQTKYRIRTRAEYLRFRGKNRAYRLSECTVFRIPNECGHFRLGITIRARGRAVDRNKVKRLIREVFASGFKKVSFDPGSFDFHVLVPITKSISYPYAKRLETNLIEELPRLCAGS